MSEHEPQATPEQEAQVRRLLARARHDEPLPDDVAARLDGVLAGLVSEGPRGLPPPPPPANVVDLGARRRRRVTGLLVAAAAVVAVGVGLGQVIGGTDGDGSADESGGSENGAASAPELDRADPGDNDSAEPPPGASEATPSAPSVAPGPPRVISFGGREFQTVVRANQDTGGLTSGDDDMVGGEDLSQSSAFTCPAAVFGPGELIGVRYEGMPAVLAYRPPVGKTQTVELLQCGTADVLRSTTLPAD